MFPGKCGFTNRPLTLRLNLPSGDLGLSYLLGAKGVGPQGLLRLRASGYGGVVWNDVVWFFAGLTSCHRGISSYIHSYIVTA